LLYLDFYLIQFQEISTLILNYASDELTRANSDEDKLIEETDEGIILIRCH
jgi:hypothetical protein